MKIPVICIVANLWPFVIIKTSVLTFQNHLCCVLLEFFLLLAITAIFCKLLFAALDGPSKPDFQPRSVCKKRKVHP